MARTLEDMKRDRGGFCRNCGKDIMGADEEDHTFCNTCWFNLLSHKFVHDPEVDPEDASICAVCGLTEASSYHIKPTTDKWARITGL